MKTLYLGLLILVFSFETLANSKFTFEPLYGVETSLVRFPEPPRYVTRATYGLRLMYGSNLLSGEMEFTQAKSRNDYPALNQKVEDSSDRVGLGIRSTFPMGKWIGLYLRAGGRASQGETVVTTGGVSKTEVNPLRIDPYAGAGLQVAISSNLAISAGATMIRNSESKYDAQYTLGITGRFGNISP